jgi:aspartate/methionine/tyrosine aminotransferase
MQLEQFTLERMQSLWENLVDYNLSESGVHPLSLAELVDGDPDAITRLAHHGLGYSQTNGTVALRERIAALYPGATPDHILVTNGTSEANFVAIWGLLEPDDELVLMLPNYMQIWGIARGFRGAVRAFHLRAETGWSPDLDELRRQVTPRTRLIAVCNPNNPTGAILRADEMRQIVECAARAGAWLLADEVYQGAERDGIRTPSFWGSYDRVIVTNGLSKAYGLPGLRIGWIAAPPELAARLWSYRDYTTIAPGALSDQIAQLALEPETRERIFARTRRILQTSYPVLSGWLRDHGALFTLTEPRAGAIAFPRYHLKLNSTALAEKLRQEQSVLIVPGDCFGMDGYVRLGYGSEAAHLQAGLARISQMLSGR